MKLKIVLIVKTKKRYKNFQFIIRFLIKELNMLGISLSEEWSGDTIYIYGIYYSNNDVFFYGIFGEQGNELIAFKQIR